MNKTRWLTAVAFAGMLAFAISTRAATCRVSIDTSALTGTNVQLALDFSDGGPPANGLWVTSFTSDGKLGVQSAIGGVSGNLPGLVSYSDTDFFSELLVCAVLGTAFSFDVAFTQNAPAAGSLPEAF